MNKENIEQLLPVQPPLPNFRAGYIAVIGLPNAGKSTLLNQLIQQKLSIVTHKPQTTRKNVLGILNAPEYQLIFMDTPGIIDPRYNLQQAMMRYVQTAISDADALVYVLDATDKRLNPEAVRQQLSGTSGKAVILAINKIDILDRRLVLPIIEKYREVYPFRAIIPISALKSDGLQVLIDEMVKTLPVSPPFYPSDYITDQQERFFVAEIIREKIFKLYQKEIPYATHVEIEAFEEVEGEKDFIQAVIYVERQTQKQILIGKKGQSLKQVGAFARDDIEQFLGRPVFLSLFVKVSKDWRKKEALLRKMGYQ